MSGVDAEEWLRGRGVALHPDGRSLLVHGRTLELEGRSLAVLKALAAQHSEPVGKDALLAAGWPSQVVHENSLAKAISRLRRALDGSGLEIVASYGVGYILRELSSARTEQVAATSSVETADPLPPPPPRSPAWIAAPIVLLLVAAGLFLSNRTQEDGVAIRNSAPITSDPPGAQATILWVDDHPSNNELEVRFLNQQRIAVHQATTTDDALKLLGINDYRLVVSDLGRGDDRLAGLKMTQAMGRRGMKTPVIIYTLRPNGAEKQRAQRQLVAQAGATDLAVTPEEVRSKVLALLKGAPSAS